MITQPVLEPVTMPEMREHLRVEHTEEDTLIDSLIIAARELCELTTRRSFITQTLRLHLMAWPKGPSLRLMRPPLQSVVAIRYVDEAGVTQPWASSHYVVDTNGERVVLQNNATWPAATLQAGSPITVDYVAGYGDEPQYVPERYRQAIRLLVAHWYENREVAAEKQQTELPYAVKALLMIDRAY
ncbi:MAG: head-tail connector protein [Caldilineaceae bacterium]|nr:head-tail connector protein [Caldilineaceae bacterium]